MKIFILPGLDGTGTLLGDFADLLTPLSDVTVLRYPPDLSAYQDLKQVVQAALPTDDYIIVAESFSGPLAAMIASENPTGLKAVVFVATFAKTPIWVPKFLTYLVDIAPMRSGLLARLAQPLLMGRWATPAFTSRFHDVMRAVPSSTIAARLRAVLQVNVVQQLSAIAVPTLYLIAGHDRLVRSRMAADFRRFSSQVVEVEGPHFLLQANATDSATQILEFMGKLD